MSPETERSLPGIGEDERITRSPCLILTWRCSPVAIRVSAALSSPCEPVQTITILLSGNRLISFESTTVSFGAISASRESAISTVWTMLRPTKATLRSSRLAVFKTCCMREIRVENVEMMRRPLAFSMMETMKKQKTLPKSTPF